MMKLSTDDYMIHHYGRTYRQHRHGIGATLRALWRQRFGLALSLAILGGALAWAVGGTGWAR